MMCFAVRPYFDSAKGEPVFEVMLKILYRKESRKLYEQGNYNFRKRKNRI